MSETPIKAPPADPSTGLGLIEFLDAAIEKGWFNVSTAKALKTSSQKIFSVENGWENLDLRSLDLDGLYERFRNLKRNEYSDDTMRIYRSRMGQAIKMHLARLDNDPAWKSYGPAARAAAPNGTTPKKGNKQTAAPSGSEATPPTEPPPPPVQPTTPSARLMQFPYPLRENLDVQLNLPRDLTKSEAERLCRFIGTLAREEQKAITAGEPA
jgi:hypothetical protein